MSSDQSGALAGAAAPSPGLNAEAGDAAENFVQIVDVVKKFGETAAVKGVNLSVKKGELFALLGSSGCGKSTLLRMLAGLESVTSGKILIDGEDLAQLPPYRRPVNMMFQSYALFPHMTVEANVAFGLKQEGVPKAELKDRVQTALELVQMGALCEAQAASAVRRSAAARGARALAGQAAEAAAARRADVRARQADPPAHADRTGQHPRQGRRDLHDGHARSGRGDDHGRTASP